jgi:hypothetical protein
MSKAGLVVIGFRKWQALPERKDNSCLLESLQDSRKDFPTFAERTLKRALGAFRNELMKVKPAKKRAVIQLIDTTMGGQKKMYNRWKWNHRKDQINERMHKLLALFQTLNFAIKSVADLAFVDNKDSLPSRRKLFFSCSRTLAPMLVTASRDGENSTTSKSSEKE